MFCYLFASFVMDAVNMKTHPQVYLYIACKYKKTHFSVSNQSANDIFFVKT